MVFISITVTNDQNRDYFCHVYDLFAGVRTEVTGSPFALASGETSPLISIKANASSKGVVAYECDPTGPSLSNIEVENGSNVSI